MTIAASKPTQIPAGALVAAVLALSVGVVGTALVFEHGLGYQPCALCLKERVAYYAAIGVSILSLGLLQSHRRSFAGVLMALVAVAYLINAGLGIYHAGVEWHWWAGPTECTAAMDLNTDASNILNTISTTHIPRCDEASWRFLLLSFAGWSAVWSAVLAALSFRAALAAVRT